MTVLERIRERARARRARIALPEGADPRVVEAAAILRRERLAEPLLVDDGGGSQREGAHEAEIPAGGLVVVERDRIDHAAAGERQARLLREVVDLLDRAERLRMMRE